MVFGGWLNAGGEFGGSYFEIFFTLLTINGKTDKKPGKNGEIYGLREK